LLAAGCSSLAAGGRNAEGVRLYKSGQYDAALRDFQEATYTDPSNPDGYYNLAATYHRLGEIQKQQSYLDQAENYYNQCLDHDPNHCECYRGLAVLLAEENRKEEAFRLVEGWIGRQPDSADARIELARLCEEYGDPGQAKEKLTEALTIEPNNPRALAALGKIREQAGDRAEALRNYERSLSYDRFQPQLAARVASLRATLGGGTTAIAGQSGSRLVEKQSPPLR
jgi:tetratricopeptide (TPR) repeat protein